MGISKKILAIIIKKNYTLVRKVGVKFERYRPEKKILKDKGI